MLKLEWLNWDNTIQQCRNKTHNKQMTLEFFNLTLKNKFTADNQ